MRIRKLLWISVLLAAFLLSGCKKDKEENNQTGLVLGFSQIGSESAWRIGNTKDIEEQAEAFGIGLRLENANQKQENQIARNERSLFSDGA